MRLAHGRIICAVWRSILAQPSQGNSASASVVSLVISVRTALKTSPVLELLKVDSKNWVRKAAFDSGDPELIELSEDLASALALTDQYCYNNVFIYFQPGSGKPLVKEPKGQLAIAKTKLKAIITAL